ncbi:MAG TPA: amidohydrolase family protein [Steroidobacteraceae bacterium]|nr:amidohydrolase family protein [Steroidobacteraceae bacterium]
MRDIIISEATVVGADAVRRAPLHMCDGRVSAASPRRDTWRITLADQLVFPGLVNAHDHLHLNSFPPLPLAAPFPNSYAWIKALQPYLADLAAGAANAPSRAQRHHHGALKNLLAGTTTVQHHDPWRPELGEAWFPARVQRNYHWSHSLGMGLGSVERSGLPLYGPEVRASFAATPPGEPWIIHLAEGTDADAEAELSRLEELGCLADNTLLVHGVGLRSSDQEKVIRYGTGVIWCPSSNLAILGRTLEPRRLFEAGRLTLGTDSRLSGARDLLEELKIARVHSGLTPRELLSLVTGAAARLLRMPLVGSLEAGCHADLIVLRDTGGDPYQQLLSATRGDLRAVVRGGTPALADPDFAEWFAVCGVETVGARLDGREKLLARAYVSGTVADPLPEAGLELLDD